MAHWLVWGSSALVFRFCHAYSTDFYKTYISNGFENHAVNAYLLLIATACKMLTGTPLYLDARLVVFGLANTLHPYWTNRARELSPSSPYTTLVTHSDALFLMPLSSVMFGSDNRFYMLCPVFSMVLAKQLMVHRENPYTRIAVDEESLRDDLQQPLLEGEAAPHLHLGFSGLSLVCIVVKDVTLGSLALDGLSIVDILFVHQVCALALALFYKYYKDRRVEIINSGPRPDYASNIVSLGLLFHHGLINYMYVASLYLAYTAIPNIGYAKLLTNLYIPIMWCARLDVDDQRCTDAQCGACWCYVVSAVGILYFGS